MPQLSILHATAKHTALCQKHVIQLVNGSQHLWTIACFFWQVMQHKLYAVLCCAVLCCGVLIIQVLQVNWLQRVQVFSLLAWAYLEAGDKPAPALSCIHSLRQLPTELSNPSVISFLALKALCQLGKLNEAETELLSVVSSSMVSLSTCLGSVKLMLTAAGGQMDIDSGNGSECGLAGVKSAISLIQERFADQPAVPVQLVRLLLAQEKVIYANSRMAE